MATGERCLIIAMKVLSELQKQGKEFDVVNARFVKPLDKELLQNLQSEYLITMEDNVFCGGFGSLVNSEIIRLQKPCKMKNYAYRDEFIPQGSVSSLQAEYGVNCLDLQAFLTEIL